MSRCTSGKYFMVAPFHDAMEDCIYRARSNIGVECRYLYINKNVRTNCVKIPT